MNKLCKIGLKKTIFKIFIEIRWSANWHAPTFLYLPIPVAVSIAGCEHSSLGLYGECTQCKKLYLYYRRALLRTLLQWKILIFDAKTGQYSVMFK